MSSLHLTAAPHRTWFFAGVIQLLAATVWWMLDLGGRYGGWFPPLSWSAPPGWLHAYLMLYGVFPFFIFGFLMTAVPNWLGEGRIPQGCYVPAAGLMLAGALTTYVGAAAGGAFLRLGAMLGLAGWALAWSGLYNLVRRSARPGGRYPFTMLALTAVGFFLGVSHLAWLLGAEAFFAELSRTGAVWFFLLPLFFNVSHRMIPFFSSRVLPAYQVVRPVWSVPLFTTASVAHGTLQLAGLVAWTWLPDGLMLVVVLYLLVAWRGWRSLGVPLLSMLHIAFAMLALALALHGVQSLAWLGGQAMLGLAPLHLLAIGYFSAMLLAMVSRVSLGHSGRPLVADRLTFACFLGVLTTAAVRVAADLVSQTPWLMPAAALLWLAAFGAWAWRYVPLYFLPRADGRPG
ncbi:MAG: NnrS family protein [Azospira oryzae]|nr:MAG: NnrS family protein [Azospira oryzae]PZP82646.1 MAG: NnrS family protein [Azospira oryzae]